MPTRLSVPLLKGSQILADEASTILAVHGLTVEFSRRDQRVIALNGVDLQLRRGELVAIVGPSGCGKSTLLNVVAGLRKHHQGRLEWPSGAAERSVGYVFQQDALLPWLSAVDNVALGLSIRGVSVDEQRRQATDYLERLDLGKFASHYPSELSGGMRQRVAIARALIYRPSLLLMDEPFGSLDALTKGQMQQLFLRVWQQDRPSVLFVTHDLAESIYLAERVILMTRRPGRIKRIFDVPLSRPRTSPFEIWTDPAFRNLYLELWNELQSEL